MSTVRHRIQIKLTSTKELPFVTFCGRRSDGMPEATHDDRQTTCRRCLKAMGGYERRRAARQVPDAPPARDADAGEPGQGSQMDTRR